jgi:hypothetical protein
VEQLIDRTENTLQRHKFLLTKLTNYKDMALIKNINYNCSYLAKNTPHKKACLLKVVNLSDTKHISVSVSVQVNVTLGLHTITTFNKIFLMEAIKYACQIHRNPL